MNITTRQFTSSQRQVTLANAYEPYGVLAQTAGSAQSSYGFTGEQTDPSGMVYLRARYYSPNDGCFLTQDPFDGNPAYPASLNPYTYGYNNPVRYTDPNGDCVEPATFFLVCLPVIMGLAAAAADVYYQVHIQHNGNWDCVDWGEVAMYGGGVAAAVLVIGVSGYALTAIPDWAIDLASLTHNLSTGSYSAARWDAVSLALPGVTGLGALSHADDAVRLLNKADYDDSYTTILIRNAGDLGEDSTRLLIEGFYNKAFHNLSPDAALIGKYIPGSSASYEQIAKAKGFAYLDLEEPFYTQFKNLYGKNANNLWRQYINLPFLEDIVRSKKIVYLSTDPTTLKLTSDTYWELTELMKRGYSYPVKDSKTGLYIMQIK